MKPQTKERMQCREEIVHVQIGESTSEMILTDFLNKLTGFLTAILSEA